VGGYLLNQRGDTSFERYMGAFIGGTVASGMAFALLGPPPGTPSRLTLQLLLTLSTITVWVVVLRVRSKGRGQP
jgi:hypothetical protein